MLTIFSQGDIVELDFSPTVGHEPTGRRPALVVSRDRFQTGTSMTLVCPITTTDNGFPLHMRLPEGLDTWGCVALEQVRACDLESRGATRIESLDPDGEFMAAVRTCLTSFL